MKNIVVGIFIFLLMGSANAVVVPQAIASVANNTYGLTFASTKSAESSISAAFNAASQAGATQAVAAQAALDSAVAAGINKKLALSFLSNSTGMTVANLATLGITTTTVSTAVVVGSVAAGVGTVAASTGGGGSDTSSSAQ